MLPELHHADRLMIPAGLQEALERFETLVRIRRNYDGDGNYVEAYAAFALAAGIDPEGLVYLSHWIEDLVEFERYQMLGEGVLLGIVIGCLGRVEADLARRDS